MSSLWLIPLTAFFSVLLASCPKGWACASLLLLCPVLFGSWSQLWKCVGELTKPHPKTVPWFNWTVCLPFFSHVFKTIPEWHRKPAGYVVHPCYEKQSENLEQSSLSGFCQTRHPNSTKPHCITASFNFPRAPCFLPENNGFYKSWVMPSCDGFITKLIVI